MYTIDNVIDYLESLKSKHGNLMCFVEPGDKSYLKHPTEDYMKNLFQVENENGTDFVRLPDVNENED